MPRARSPSGEKSRGLGTMGLCDPAHPCSHALGAQLPASPSIASAFAFDGAVVGTPLQRPLRNLSDTMRACLFAQSCPTLCSSMDCSPPGSSVHGILQARILEWVAISSSRGSS